MTSKGFPPSYIALARLQRRLRQHFETSPDPQRAAELEKQLILIKRFLDPEEIAQAALYLAPDRARGVTGTALVVDGGTLAGYVE